jgi:hypothetical protein
MMRTRLLTMVALLTAGAVLVAGSAGAATVRVGTLVLHADGGFEPQVLPKRTYAPIHFQGFGEIKTTDHSIPPALQHVTIDFDHDGHLTTAGLSVCMPSQLEGATTEQARQRCKAAIVGTGRIGAAVSLAGIARIDLRSPLTVFNGPRRDGNPTAIIHAQAPFPVSETYVIVIPIERIHGSIYGYRVSFDIPPIAGGLGSLTYISSKIGRLYRSQGQQRSYISARCSDYILQTQGYFSFDDGNVVYGSVFKACRPEG